MTTEINYEQKVKEVYPKSYVDNPEFHRFYYVYADLIGVEIGKGLNMQKAWQSAYEKLVSSGKIQPDQPTKSDAEVVAEREYPYLDESGVPSWADMPQKQYRVKQQREAYIKGYNAKQSDAVEFYNFTQGMPVDAQTGQIYFNKEWHTIEQLYEQFKNR